MFEKVVNMAGKAPGFRFLSEQEVNDFVNWRKEEEDLQAKKEEQERKRKQEEEKKQAERHEREQRERADEKVRREDKRCKPF